MSILIKGMELPTSCSDCKLRMAVGCCGNLPHNTRMPNCPLFPVPAHGDLIDRDDLRNKEVTINYDEWYDTFDDGFLFVTELIDNAPTIIPADPPVMYYPQVPGITPTVIAEEGERC